VKRRAFLAGAATLLVARPAFAARPLIIVYRDPT
jgi:hypothetical protein